jgi:hypothetical protein
MGLAPYLLYNGQNGNIGTMFIYDDMGTPNDYSDDLDISSFEAKNHVTSSSKGKWEDGVYSMQDSSTPYTHGDETDDKGVLKDSDNGAYGSGGIFRAENFIETTTDEIRTGMGIHAGREDADWETGRKTLGCIRVKPEGFDEIENAISEYGSLTKIVVQENRQSDNSSGINRINPGIQDPDAITDVMQPKMQIDQQYNINTRKLSGD